MKQKNKEKKIISKALVGTVAFSMLANPICAFAENNTVGNDAIKNNEIRIDKEDVESDVEDNKNHRKDDGINKEDIEINKENIESTQEDSEISKENGESTEAVEVSKENKDISEEDIEVTKETTEKALLSVDDLIKEMKSIKYEDLYKKLNPRVSYIDRLNIQTALTKELGRVPSQEEIEARVTKIYMEKIGLKKSFENVMNNLQTTITKVFQNTQSADIQYAVEKKMDIITALTYLERQYSFSFGEKQAKDLIIYANNTDALYTLTSIGQNLDYFALDLSRNIDTYKNKLAWITGYDTLTEFIEGNVKKYVSGKTAEQWFKETTKATVVETSSINGNSSLFNKFKTDANISKHLIPLLNLSEDSIYALSSTSSVTYGLMDTYVDKANADVTKNNFINELKSTAKKQQNFLDFWFRISDKRDLLRNSQNIVVIDTMKKYSSNPKTPSKNLWLDETGNNSSSGINEFMSPFRYYSPYLGADAEASGEKLIKFFQAKAIGDYGVSTYTHEMTHLLDQKVWMDGKARRAGQGAEVFARGLFEVYDNTPGKSSYSPFFNLNLAYDLGENRIQNKNPERFKQESDLKQYMQGVMDVVYTLDYLEAEASLKRTNSEKTILFNKLELTKDEKRPGQVRDTFKNIDEKTAEKLKTIDDLIDNSISSGRLTYQGMDTIGTVGANGYHIAPMFEPIYAAVKNDTGSAGDISFRRYAFDMLAEYGYKDGMIPYISNQYANDTEAFNHILSGYNGDFTAFKKAMFKRRIDNIKNLKSNGNFSSLEDLQNKMNDAVAKDLKIMQDNKKYGNFITMGATNVRDLKTKVFQDYLKSTDDFRTSIYKEQAKTPIKFETIYQADESLEKGKQITQIEGVNGEMTDGIITLKPVNKVVRVGTKPTVVIKEIPFEIKKNPNPNMYEDEKEKVVVEGVTGSKEITTTYRVDKNTGEVIANNPVEKVTREKVDRVIEFKTEEMGGIEEDKNTINKQESEVIETEEKSDETQEKLENKKDIEVQEVQSDYEQSQKVPNSTDKAEEGTSEKIQDNDANKAQVNIQKNENNHSILYSILALLSGLIIFIISRKKDK